MYYAGANCLAQLAIMFWLVLSCSVHHSLSHPSSLHFHCIHGLHNIFMLPTALDVSYCLLVILLPVWLYILSWHICIVITITTVASMANSILFSTFDNLFTVQIDLDTFYCLLLASMAFRDFMSIWCICSVDTFVADICRAFPITLGIVWCSCFAVWVIWLL